MAEIWSSNTSCQCHNGLMNLIIPPPSPCTARTALSEMQLKAKEASEARRDRIDKAMGINLAPMSDTQRYHLMREQGKLPESSSNWHLGKLKPWMHREAIDLGKKLKREAEAQPDPFQKVHRSDDKRAHPWETHLSDTIAV